MTLYHNGFWAGIQRTTRYINLSYGQQLRATKYFLFFFKISHFSFDSFYIRSRIAFTFVEDIKENPMKLTEAEWQIMKALWENFPATTRQIAERLPDEINWAYTTIKTMLTRLADKKVVK